MNVAEANEFPSPAEPEWTFQRRERLSDTMKVSVGNRS
jgi:hypothetical protein